MRGSISTEWEDHIPMFTGWKDVPLNPNTADETPTGKYVGQWICWDKPTKSFVAVNLPGMEVSRGFEGDILDIGTERVTDDTLEVDVKAMLATGLARLQKEDKRPI